MGGIKRIHEYVKAECEKDTNPFTMTAYTDHFVPMVRYAKQLANKLQANSEVVELAAWLHDIGSIQGHYEDHHTYGAEVAEELLRELGYTEKTIEGVKHCILTHRSSKRLPRKTLEAKIIASADAMPHFDSQGFVSLFHLAFEVHGLSIEDARSFVRNKLQGIWEKMLPEAQKMARPKYEAAMRILS